MRSAVGRNPSVDRVHLRLMYFAAYFLLLSSNRQQLFPENEVVGVQLINTRVREFSTFDTRRLAMCTRHLGRDWICSERLRLLILKCGPEAAFARRFCSGKRSAPQPHLLRNRILVKICIFANISRVCTLSCRFVGAIFSRSARVTRRSQRRHWRSCGNIRVPAGPWQSRSGAVRLRYCDRSRK